MPKILTDEERVANSAESRKKANQKWVASNREYNNAMQARLMKRRYQFNKEWKKLRNIDLFD